MEWRREVEKSKVANMSEWLDERERKSLLRQIVRNSLRQPQTNVANQGRVVAETRSRNAITCIDRRVRAHGLIRLLKTGKMRFAKVQDAMRDGYVVSERGRREGSRKGKFPSLARKKSVVQRSWWRKRGLRLDRRDRENLTTTEL